MYKFTGGEEGKKGEGRVVQEFERSALVKEYVWRTRGGEDLSFGELRSFHYGCDRQANPVPWADDREFQLITLGTDRTVKMEYIPPAVLEVSSTRYVPFKPSDLNHHLSPRATFAAVP